LRVLVLKKFVVLVLLIVSRVLVVLLSRMTAVTC